MLYEDTQEWHYDQDVVSELVNYYDQNDCDNVLSDACNDIATNITYYEGVVASDYERLEEDAYDIDAAGCMPE